MGAAVVAGAGRDEAAAAPVLDGEFPARRIADRLHRVIAVGETGDLQLDVELVRPEPRHRIVRLRLAEDRGGGSLGLVDRVLHALEPHPATVAAAGKTCAVADRIDAGSGGAGEFVYQDAVLAGETGRRREVVVGARPGG